MSMSSLEHSLHYTRNQDKSRKEKEREKNKEFDIKTIYISYKENCPHGRKKERKRITGISRSEETDTVLYKSRQRTNCN